MSPLPLWSGAYAMLSVMSSPAWDKATQQVYVGSDDGNLWAVKPTGFPEWKYATQSYVRSSPTVDRGTVYVGSFDADFYAVSTAEGEPKWKVSMGAPVLSSAAVSSDGGLVVIGSDNKNVSALASADGALKWSFQTNGSVQATPTITTIENEEVALVACADTASPHNYMYAIALGTGELRWSFLVPKSQGPAGPVSGAVVSTAAVADGYAYFGSNDHSLFKLDASTGALIWQAQTGDGVDSSPVVADGKVFVGSNDYNVYAFDASDGTVLWKYRTGGVVYSSPTVGPDGTVYVGSVDASLYALHPADGSVLWSYSVSTASHPLPSGLGIHSSPTLDDAGRTVYVGADDGYLYAVWTADGTLRFRCSLLS